MSFCRVKPLVIENSNLQMCLFFLKLLISVRKRPKMSRESTSIRALQIIRDQLRQARAKKPTAKFAAPLGPYCATSHVFEYINQVKTIPVLSGFSFSHGFFFLAIMLWWSVFLSTLPIFSLNEPKQASSDPDRQYWS